MTHPSPASFWARHRACTLHAGRHAVVLDSPHSGALYPTDFRPACSMSALRVAEDTDVDALWSFAPGMGVSLLQAHFPRSYIDVNRSLAEVDPTMLDGHWPDTVTDGPKVRLGKGLVWRQLDDGTPIYDRLLSVQELRQRIEHCWRPYHRLLGEAVEAAHRSHGAVVHLNCHSMPSVAQAYSTEHPWEVHADFVLGDRDATSANPALTHWIERFLNSRGYTVSVNHPYKGVEIVRRHGRPAEHRHSIQLEVNKRLYLNEATLERLPEFDRVQQTLRELLERLLTLDLSM